jgi:hypothetical protein
MMEQNDLALETLPDFDKASESLRKALKFLEET